MFFKFILINIIVFKKGAKHLKLQLLKNHTVNYISAYKYSGCNILKLPKNLLNLNVAYMFFVLTIFVILV